MNKPYFSMPIAEWAGCLGSSEPDLENLDIYLPEEDFAAPVSHDWEYDKGEGLTEDFWEVFRQAFGISPTIGSDEIRDHLNWSFEAAWEDHCRRRWMDAIEGATEKILGFLTPDSYHPVNFMGDWETPPMKLPENFPDLQWEIAEGELRFFGSPAPLIYLGMATLQGVNGARFSGIREWMDVWGDGAIGYAARLCAEEMPGVFGFSADTSWNPGDGPSWDIYDAIKAFKEDENYKDWFQSM